jgi:hypothetical protein
MSKQVRFFLAAGFLASMLGISGVAAAQGGGGGHGGGGGGHAGGGGGHAGGGHVGGGGGHFAGGHVGGGVSHYASAGVRGGYGAGYAGVRGGVVGGARYVGGGHPAYGYGAGYGRGFSAGTFWHGGYWHGGYWPGAYYGAGYAWFLPFLPAVYATYWWNGYPYYYANDVYYTWNPSYDGYVATDPPPVTEDGSAPPPATAPGAAAPGAAISSDMDVGVGGQQIFMYPKNGQSAEQQSSDRRDCQQWAASQVGQGGQPQAADYRRAMLACVEGRGYSAK